MRVRDWMTPEPVTVTPQTSVMSARRILLAQGIRHLPVVEGGRVVGMLSDADLLLRDSQMAQALSALQSDLLGGRYRRVESIMITPVHVVRPDETVRAAAEKMGEGRVNSLPVVEDGALIGIITTTDCLRALLRLLDEAAPQSGGPASSGATLQA